MLSVLPADHITDYMNNTLVKYEPILLPTSSRNLHKDRITRILRNLWKYREDGS